MIRVAIADDSPFTCHLLASYVEAAGDCEVVAVAHDARATIDLVRRLAPDVLTLDLAMPGGDGLALLREVAGSVSVVVISGVTRGAAATTLRALEYGAVDFVLKYVPGVPMNPVSLQREIMAKVKMAATATRPRARAAARAAAEPAPPALPGRPSARVRDHAPGVVVIGASTGGPQAVSELLSRLPADLASPCVIVQHLPPSFTAAFAEQLQRVARVVVEEAGPQHRLAAGCALVAPGSSHLIVGRGGQIELRPADRDEVYRPSIDLTMTSAAESYGPDAIGVVLTGMGCDGADGLKRIRECGGEAYVQDPASCVVASMPLRALERAGADFVAPPDRIGDRLLLRGRLR